MDRTFLDANILFSAAYGLSTMDQLWDLSRQGKCILIASEYVIEEAKRNLATENQTDRLGSYMERIEIVPEADPTIVCTADLPEKDQPVLMAAVSANADYLLTGDMRHVGRYFGQIVLGVRVLMVRDYILLASDS